MQKDSAGFFYKNISAASTAKIKTGVGLLHTVTINKPVANGVVALYDAIVGSGATLGTITLPGTLLSEGPATAIYDIAFENGLTVVVTGSLDVTISYG